MTEFGYFEDARREYVITTPLTPRPWENRIWNNDIVVQVTNHGSAITYERDHKGGFILYNWSGNRALYVLDRDTGTLWSPCWYPVNETLDAYECRHGIQYTTVSGEKDGVRVTWTTTVPDTGCAELWTVRIQPTDGAKHRVLLATFYELDLSCRDPYFGARNRYAGSATPQTLQVENTSPLRTSDRYRLTYRSSLPIQGFELSREGFFKRYSDLSRPATIVDDAFTGSLPDRDPPVFAVRYELELDGPVALDVAIGPDDVEPTAIQFGPCSPRDVDPGCTTVQVGDADFERYANIWIRHQLAYNACWNRGWNMGFRDAMQDSDAYRIEDPAQPTRRLLEAAAHIYADGHTVRKWAAIDDKLYFDGGVWFVNTLVSTVNETGDTALLDRRIPYLDEGEGTVLDHARRALDFLGDQTGPHGLCRMGFGDWNDAFTGVDRAGKGESVWTSMAYVWALRRLASLVEAPELEQRAEAMADLVNSVAFDGDRYLRAFTDAGRPVGAQGTRTFLNPQSWALIAGIADAERAETVIGTVERELMTPYGPLLLSPPFDGYREDIGRLSSDAPGCVENGANYVHASMFYAYALARASRPDAALDIMKRVLPDNPDNPSEVSGLEPYQLTNQYEGTASRHPGRALFAWRTGSAGWWLKTLWDGLLGIVPELDGLRVRPALPKAFGAIEATRRVRGNTYVFVFGDNAATCDPVVRSGETLAYDSLKPRIGVLTGVEK